MYNRYVPSSDGSYQRNRLPDKAQPQRTPDRRRPAQQRPCPPPICPSPPPCREPAPEPPHSAAGIGSFLKNLLPKDFDTEDLLVILLFLLMSKDKEDQNSALLTLALYLFM